MAENNVIMGKNKDGGEVSIAASMANRHGLIAGATGTGKTVTLETMAEGFSAMGVPVFLADVKGDISGLASGGDFPVTFWDIYGKGGIPLRTTISEMGPMLLSRVLKLTDVQEDILAVVFKIADDENLLLTDTKDLKSMLAYVSERAKEYESSYGRMSGQSLAAITRAVVALEAEGGEIFFGEPALSVTDWFLVGSDGKGMLHILDSSSLINSPKLYAAFLLWLLSELFENLPEVGDTKKPKMVFFFDEAHLLFKDASKTLKDKIEQVVKLIRSKGVGIYFITQNPADIPGGVLSQLSNKVEHALHAYSPAEQKGVKAAAMAFPKNPDLDTYEAITNLGTGEAVVSFLGEDGVPQPAQIVKIDLPKSALGAIEASARSKCIRESLLYGKYYNSVDNDSAYEFLMRRGMEKEQAKQQEIETAKQKKELAAEEKRQQKEAEKAAKQDMAARKRAVKSVGNSVAGTVGRQVGKELGKSFGSFGKQLGGNVGASLGRGLLSTLLKL